MQTQARIVELSLMAGSPAAQIECPAALAPGPGGYVLAHEEGSRAPLSTALFAGGYGPTGFVACPPFPREWHPGTVLNVRGPLGRGFQLPSGSRRVALIALSEEPIRLLPLAAAALQQNAAVALVCDRALPDLPLQIEIHPMRALDEACGWCDYAACDVEGESREGLARGLALAARIPRGTAAQALVRVPMPCGGLAACGVCAVRTTEGQKLACIDGPVFDLKLLLTEGQQGLNDPLGGASITKGI